MQYLECVNAVNVICLYNTNKKTCSPEYGIVKHSLSVGYFIYFICIYLSYQGLVFKHILLIALADKDAR